MKRQEQKPVIIFDENKDKYISLYNDELANDLDVAGAIKIISVSFDLKNEYLILLSNKFIENKFTKQRLIDAVNHVIKTCIYPKPTLAQFLKFDEQMKLYNYRQYGEMVNQGVGMESIVIEDKRYWIEK